MSKGRMEAFSDGVIAILITIMVLGLSIPRGRTLASLAPLAPVFLTYALSFIFLGIYWSNHHHLLQAVEHVDGRTLWANLHLLFWLSLVPFATNWVGQSDFATWPVMLYGCVFLLAAIAYFILTRALLTLHGKDSTLATALGADWKGKVSLVIYAFAIPLSLVSSSIGCALYVVVAGMWLVPDRRIERVVGR